MRCEARDNRSERAILRVGDMATTYRLAARRNDNAVNIKPPQVDSSNGWQQKLGARLGSSRARERKTTTTEKPSSGARRRRDGTGSRARGPRRRHPAGCGSRGGGFHPRPLPALPRQGGTDSRRSPRRGFAQWDIPPRKPHAHQRHAPPACPGALLGPPTCVMRPNHPAPLFFYRPMFAPESPGKAAPSLRQAAENAGQGVAGTVQRCQQAGAMRTGEPAAHASYFCPLAARDLDVGRLDRHSAQRVTR